MGYLILGWSAGVSGTDVVLRHGLLPSVPGAVLLSPPLRFVGTEELTAWSVDGRPLRCSCRSSMTIYRPNRPSAPSRGAAGGIVPVSGAKHLWVGESAVRTVLDAITAEVAPWVATPLPTEWDGPMSKHSDLLGRR